MALRFSRTLLSSGRGGFLLAAALMGGSALAAPSPMASPAASTVSSPAGLLTPLEQKRHERFVQSARAGDIDLLFIGDSAVDFWRYDWGGQSDWNKYYSARKAANFGVEGAGTQSILWRLQNGELDGFRAKVIVFNGTVATDVTKGAAAADVLARNAAIVAELGKRQPQAKILLLVAPRSWADSPGGAVEASLRGAFARLADGRTVHYLDMSSAFAGKADMRGAGSAFNANGYHVWAQAMNPTLGELMKSADAG